MDGQRFTDRVMNLGDILTQTARRLPDRPGLIVGSYEETWQGLLGRVDALAHGLRSLGVAKGDRVVVQSRNRQEMFETMFAVFKIGAVWVPTNYRIHPSDMDHIVRLSGARVLICEDVFPDHADIARAAGVATTIAIGRARADETGYDALLAAHLGRPFDSAAVSHADPCWFFLTSGTTGRSKAAVLSHGQMAFVVTNHLADLMPDLTERDRSLVVAPLSHGAGINQLVVTARGVATVLTEAPRLDPEEVFRQVERHRIANMFTVPTILHALVSHEAAGRHDHSSLRSVIYAGAPMLREHQRRALQVLGPCIVQYFGLGEVTGNITFLPARLHSADDGAMKVGSCGYARTGMQISIQDDGGAMLPPGQTGEICVIGPAVFNGYYRNPEANAEAFRNGWFRTGDLGFMDAEGYLFITGRRSDMFISGGSNIYPIEIEEKIAAHPLVREACVLGMPDETWGEVGHAVVSLHAGASLTHAELVAYLRDRLASYKIPRALHVVDDLPKSAYGKITKNMLRALLAEKTTN